MTFDCDQRLLVKIKYHPIMAGKKKVLIIGAGAAGMVSRNALTTLNSWAALIKSI